MSKSVIKKNLGRVLKKNSPFLLILICSSCNALCKYCNLLEFRKWRTDYYSEQCVFSSYHEKWEDKNCKFRIVKPDASAKRVLLDPVTLQPSEANLGQIQQ